MIYKGIGLILFVKNNKTINANHTFHNSWLRPFEKTWATIAHDFRFDCGIPSGGRTGSRVVETASATHNFRNVHDRKGGRKRCATDCGFKHIASTSWFRFVREWKWNAIHAIIGRSCCIEDDRKQMTSSGVQSEWQKWPGRKFGL